MIDSVVAVLDSFKNALYYLESCILGAEELEHEAFLGCLGVMKKTWELSLSVVSEFHFNMAFNGDVVPDSLLGVYLDSRFAYLEERVKERVRECHESLGFNAVLPENFLIADSSLLIQHVNSLSDDVMKIVKDAYKGLGEVEGVYPRTDLWANMQDFFVLGFEDLLDFPTTLLQFPQWSVFRFLLRDDGVESEKFTVALTRAWERYMKTSTFELQAVFRQSLREEKVNELTKVMLDLTMKALRDWVPWQKEFTEEKQVMHEDFLLLLGYKGIDVVPFQLL